MADLSAPQDQGGSVSIHPPSLKGWDYLKLPVAPETWLIEPFIPAGGSCLLFAPPKIGKTWLALQMAFSIQGSEEFPDWLGFPIRQRGLVLYAQLDVPRSLWFDRYIKFSVGNGIQTAGELHYADRETLAYPFDATNPDHISRLRFACAIMPEWPVLVVIDTLREAHMLNENDSTDMKNVVSSIKAAVYPSAVLFIAHDRKGSADGPSDKDVRNANRGSGYTVGAMDTVLYLSKTRLDYIGRAIEEGGMKVNRRADLCWEQDIRDFEAQLRLVVGDPSLPTLYAKARALAERTGKGEEACRSVLRRGLHAVG